MDTIKAGVIARMRHPHLCLERGRVLSRQLRCDPDQHYFLYLPAVNLEQARVLVSVHGISRNGRRHVKRFAELAEREGVIIVAPLFEKHRYPGYQRLGLSGERADLMLQRMLHEVSQMTGADTTRFYLFGYSGGGQFAHRYAMAYPQQIVALAIGAAGWYTWPDPQQVFPHGIAPHRKLPGVTFDPAQFLRIPTCVLVGEADTERDDALRQCEQIDAYQGTTRLERGQRWLQTMQQAAIQHGYATDYRFVALPEADHSFSRSVRAGAMDQQVFNYFFKTILE